MAKLDKIINYIEKELSFIERWLNSNPGDMEEYLKGRRAALREVFVQLEQD